MIVHRAVLCERRLDYSLANYSTYRLHVAHRACTVSNFPGRLREVFRVTDCELAVRIGRRLDYCPTNSPRSISIDPVSTGRLREVFRVSDYDRAVRIGRRLDY